MPNAIKYSTTGDTLSLKKGNIFFGVGDVGKGPSSATTYYNGVTPSASGYTIYSYNASQTSKLSFHSANSDSALIMYTNGVSGQNFSTATQCLNWYATQTNYVCVNRDYEGIVLSGLTLCLDAGFTPSYTTSGASWYDLSYGGNNSTLVNGPTYSSFSGGSIVLDGVDDYVNCGNSSSLQITGSITTETWVYMSSLNNSNDVNLLSKYSNTGGAGNQGWLLFKSTADYRVYGPGGTGGPNNNEFAWLATSNGNFDGALIGTGEQVLTNTWYQVVGIFSSDNNTIQIYVNGKLKRSGVRTNQTSGVLLNSARNVYIGSTPEDGARYLQGSVMSSKIYNIALNSDEVSQNFFALVPIIRNGLVFNLVVGNPISYRSGSSVWIDPIGGSRGTLTNGPTFSSSGSSSSIVFDGSDDAVIWSSNPLSSLTTSKTYELWVRFDSTIVNTFTISCGSYMVYLENKNTWYINQAGASNSYVSWTFNSGWNHFVYSFDGSNHLCYINGTSRTINFGSGVGSQTNLYIGNRVNMDSPMKGNIAITRMYNRGLSASEIIQNFNAQRSVFGI